MNNTNKEERAYHHGDLRQSLIDAACRHLRESGADTLSLRALARDVGVSQTAPYRHFESKNALFAAIATYGFKMMAVELQKATDKHADDVEQAFIEVGLAYINWAQNNSEKYQLFFDSSLVDFPKYKDLQDAGEAAFKVLINIIKEGIEQGVFVDRPLLEMAGTVWAGIHGAASLLISKSHMMDNDVGDHLAMQVMQQIATDSRPHLELFLNALRKPC